MELSLFSRDVIALAAAVGLSHNVFDAAAYFPQALAHTPPALRLQLHVQEIELFVREPAVGEELLSQFTATSTTAIPGGELRLELTATRAFVKSEASRIIYVVLFGGFLVTGLLILSTHLAVRSWQAQVAFHHQYSRHRLVVNHLPAMIAAFDAQNHLIFANAPFVALVGAKSEQDILGGTPRELLGPYYDEVAQHLQRVLAGDTVRYEVTVEAEKDMPRCLETQLVPHRPAGGPVDSYYALVLDVTEERESTRRLAVNSERLRRISGLSIGREERMIALKEEVNQLLRELNREDRYRIVQLDQDRSEGEGE